MENNVVKKLRLQGSQHLLRFKVCRMFNAVVSCSTSSFVVVIKLRECLPGEITDLLKTFDWFPEYSYRAQLQRALMALCAT